VSDDETFARWDGWLSKIHDDVTELLIARNLFTEVAKIVRANRRIHGDNS
jgi:hypothetical protein